RLWRKLPHHRAPQRHPSTIAPARRRGWHAAGQRHNRPDGAAQNVRVCVSLFLINTRQQPAPTIGRQCALPFDRRGYGE
ncbi:MAG TPA: hypothetical protein VIV12_03810, partial [Streptosporangiaceae bacterium]